MKRRRAPIVLEDAVMSELTLAESAEVQITSLACAGALKHRRRRRVTHMLTLTRVALASAGLSADKLVERAVVERTAGELVDLAEVELGEH